MGVSALVTLLILVVLEASVYGVVSASIEAGAQAQLKAIAGVADTGTDDPYGFTVVGPKAGLIPIPVDPLGHVLVARDLPAVPPGLPDLASLAAVSRPGDVDIRNYTCPDGSSWRIISLVSTSPRYTNFKVQWAQSRTPEINLLNTLGIVLLGGGLIALLAALLAGYLYAGRALVPIRASIDRRQAALQRQREFAANASHELRTPLTVIGASVEDLKRNRRSKVEDVGEALGDIEAEVGHMTALVEDMLLLARTDSGVVQIERVPLDMGDIAAEAAGMLSAVGQERGVGVVLDPLPAPVSGDPMRLRQLVTILVDNAIRHSPVGSTVTVLVRPEAGVPLFPLGGALLEVDDQGPGIKPEDLSCIFERFWRADDAPAGGTGLGLAIARWIVDQHGGSIGAANRPEGGASFWVRLPNLPVEVASPGDDPMTSAPDQYQWAGPDSSAP
ncbi:MAG TPA: HAMP domain-containing sensor histidine kinase [Candidatus Limnocylindrales bacterium]|jgi:signal transduction histidine kinase